MKNRYNPPGINPSPTTWRGPVSCRWLLLAALTFTACAPAVITPPPQAKHSETEQSKNAEKATVEPQVAIDSSKPETTWDAMFLQGQKIGYGSTTRAEELLAGKLVGVRWQAKQVMRLQRFGQTTEQTIEFQTRESPTGELQKLQAQLSGGTLNMETVGEVQDGLLQLTISTQGRKSTLSIPWPAETYGFFGVEQSLRQQPMHAGEKRRITWFQPVVNQLATDELEAIAEESVPLLQERRQLLKIKSTSKFAGQTIHSFFWADDQGNVLKSSIPGLMQEVYRTSPEIAMKPGEGNFDLGRSSVVKVKRALPNHVDTKRVVYQATLKAAKPAEVFPVCLSQSIEVIDDHTAKIIVSKVTPDLPEKVSGEILQPTPADSAPNNLIQSDDINVLKLAKQVAPHETDSWKTALAIEEFVNTKLTKKNFSQGFATAAEVAKNLEGDCTEHAVLLAAICRARRIPARVAAGLVYYGPEQGFAYHMWNEVWVQDRWVPLDATLARGGIGGGHLKLFDSNLEGAGAFSAFLPVINVLGQLELEILAVE